MCIKILKNGLKCKNKNKNEYYCHIHKNKIQEEGLEIKNNKLINHNIILLIEIEKIKELNNNFKKEIINLNKTVEKKNKIISFKNIELNTFKKNNNELFKSIENKDEKIN